MVASLAHYRIFPLRKPTEPFFRKLCAHRLQEDAEDIDFFFENLDCFSTDCVCGAEVFVGMSRDVLSSVGGGG